MTAGTFPLDVIAAARRSQAKWDIPASVCLAQWALESAWGSAMPPGSNNPFGIKAVGAEPSVSCPTHEVVGGRRIAVHAAFRKFASLAEAFDAHGALLAASRHYAAARRVRHDPEAFARALTGTYATDPNYGSKLTALMRAHRLTEYDAGGTVAAVPPVVAPPHLLPAASRPGFWPRLWSALTGKVPA